MPTLTLRRGLVTLVAALLAAPAAFAQEAPARSGATATDTVVVFAAASLRNALDNISRQWTAATGKKATFSYASSGALARQIESGAPADLFASADLKWMDYVAGKGLIKADTRQTLLANSLVLIAPKDADTRIDIAKGFKLADAIGDGKLAMGIPGTVPAGTYAKAALTSLGVWDEVSPKVAGAQNVRAALAFVARGEARLGIVYATDARAEPNVKVIGTFPPDSHPPIVYPFAVTAATTNPAAGDLLAFLRSPDAVKSFEAEGFAMVAKP